MRTVVYELCPPLEHLKVEQKKNKIRDILILHISEGEHLSQKAVYERHSQARSQPRWKISKFQLQSLGLNAYNSIGSHVWFLKRFYFLVFLLQKYLKHLKHFWSIDHNAFKYKMLVSFLYENVLMEG